MSSVEPTIEDAYLAAFEQAIDEDPDVLRAPVEFGSYLFRRAQLLTSSQDADAVEAELRGRNVGLGKRRDGSIAPGVVLLDTEDGVDIPSLVNDFRTSPRDGRIPDLHPHHVIVGHPGKNIMGHPDKPPAAADALPQFVVIEATYEGIRVGICDTGIWKKANTAHAPWLTSFQPAAGDFDPLYLPNQGDRLGLEAGHGTFVAGVVQQAAPGVPFDPEVALNINGIGDEAMLAAALQGFEEPPNIIVLSLGCHTADNLEPILIRQAIEAFPPEVVIVAAAGNSGWSRPNWPAASQGVIAVGATEPTETGGPWPAPYSNYGDWVDVWAPGTHTSTYVPGHLDLNGFQLVFGGDGPWAQWSGTSFAAPYVAGWIARTAAESGRTPREVADELLAMPATFGRGVLLP